jgi:CRISPR-associated protein Csd1
MFGNIGQEAKDPEYTIKRFEAFCQWNTEMLGKVNNPASKAVIAFLDNYDPAKGREHPKIAAHMETILNGGNLVFMFNGGFVHEDAAIRQAWELHKSSSDAVLGQCLITGEIAPIARLHPNFAVRGATNRRITD